ncbi:MAG: VWA domain-containing protein [Pseudonocardia sp.]|uniref:VWA domain-containing protein n=1 Tax=Pseudonocardia sp. TaxID=60912 RepID=UPI001ACCB9A0|nr:VWA domain-containing protein [Pseudonocardia sp.]MBN9097972.1 VWA domain-containing protein [Pseudonocardia sp.]
MSTHLITDPTTAPAAPVTDPAWLALSVAMTDEVPVIAERDDLLVTIAPGAGRGAPACFLPALATIEVNGYHLAGIDPATVTPHRLADRARYGPAWGLLVHECAHAAHSVWEPPPGAPPGAVAAAMELEESRIEAVQVARRPDDRRWLRASATHLILDESGLTDPARTLGVSRADAGHAAALLLARVEAGILNPDEVEPVTRVVTDVLGEPTLAVLQEIWSAAHTTADTDAETMIDLGRRWCDALGTDPDTAPGTRPDSASGTAGDPTDDAAPTRGPSPMSGAISDAMRRIVDAVGREPVPGASDSAPPPAPTGADPAARAAVDAAARVFGPATPHGSGAASTGIPGGGARDVIAGTRPPTPDERRAARQVGRSLDTAGVRDRVTTRTTSTLPPGRLRMRSALAADAQRAAGAIPTAEPFTRTTRRAVPTPPLRLGIACDVSSSMREFAKPVSAAAWILAHAAAHTRVPATTATVAFGDAVHAITHPGAVPKMVTRFRAPDGYEVIDDALDALDGALHLSTPGAARLLVVVSDGIFSPAPRRAAQTRVDRLRAAGCGVLWLAPRGPVTPLDGVTAIPLTDPTVTARAIARAATAALRATP